MNFNKISMWIRYIFHMALTLQKTLTKTRCCNKWRNILFSVISLKKSGTKFYFCVCNIVFHIYLLTTFWIQNDYNSNKYICPSYSWIIKHRFKYYFNESYWAQVHNDYTYLMVLGIPIYLFQNLNFIIGTKYTRVNVEIWVP